MLYKALLTSKNKMKSKSELGHLEFLKIVKTLKNLFANSLQSNEKSFIYFRKKLGNKGKRKFSASRAVFSCKTRETALK